MYDIIRPTVVPQDEQMLMMSALSNLKKSEPKRASTALRFIEPALGPAISACWSPLHGPRVQGNASEFASKSLNH